MAWEQASRRCCCHTPFHLPFRRSCMQATWRNQNEPAFQDAIGRVVLEGAQVGKRGCCCHDGVVLWKAVSCWCLDLQSV